MNFKKCLFEKAKIILDALLIEKTTCRSECQGEKRKVMCVNHNKEQTIGKTQSHQTHRTESTDD